MGLFKCWTPRFACLDSMRMPSQPETRPSYGVRPRPSLPALKATVLKYQSELTVLQEIEQLRSELQLTDPGTPTQGDAAHEKRVLEFAKCVIEKCRLLDMARDDYLSEAVTLLKAMVQSGSNADALFVYANYLITGCPYPGRPAHTPEYAQAFALYTDAANLGHADAAFHAGLCLEHGRGVPGINLFEALRFYKSAAASNHPGALYRLGMIYLGPQRPDASPPTVSPNIRDAVRWLHASARYATRKHCLALYQLALLYTPELQLWHMDMDIPPPLDIGQRGSSSPTHDINHPPSPSRCQVFPPYEPYRSLALLDQAAELGHLQSKLILAFAFHHGCLLPVRRHLGKAVQFYRQAAEAGHAQAMMELSGCLLEFQAHRLRRFGLSAAHGRSSSDSGQSSVGSEELELSTSDSSDEDWIFLDDSSSPTSSHLQTQSTVLRLNGCSNISCALYVPNQQWPFRSEDVHLPLATSVCKAELEAFDWARKAADAGVVQASYAVGWFLERAFVREALECLGDDRHTHVDASDILREALDWYRCAARQGDPSARLRLRQLGLEP